MPVNPRKSMERLERVLNAWTTLAVNKQFGGMDKQQFEAFVAASRSSRTTIANLETQLKEAIALRDLNDGVALAKAQLVKNGVLADPENGENSVLYESMGYVRKDDKKSGLTRKSSNGKQDEATRQN